jgi:hypothetical protein
VRSCGDITLVAYAGGSGASTGWVRSDRLQPGKEGVPDLAWLAAAVRATPHPDIAWEPRFEAMLEDYVPVSRVYVGMSVDGKPMSLFAAVRETMPSPQLQLLQGRYVLLTSCRLHSCQEKGMIWIDPQTHRVIGAFVHFAYGPDSATAPKRRALLIWSADLGQAFVPAEFAAALKAWNGSPVRQLADGEPEQPGAYYDLRVVARDGHVTEVTDTDLGANQ